MGKKRIELPEKADFSYIQDIAGGKNAAFENLLKIVRKNLELYPPQILEVQQSGDLAEMKRLAHKYKSCTAYLNFPPLDELLNELEYGDIEERSSEEVETIISHVSQLSEFLKKEVDRELA